MAQPKQDKKKQGLYGKVAIMALLDFARCDPRLTAQDFVYLQAIGSRVNEDTIGLRTQSMIAYEMGVSHTTVGKHEKKLIQYGYLIKKRRTARGVKNKYQYEFNLKLAQKPKTPDDLRFFRELQIVFCEARSETPNGFKQRYPQKIKKSETSDGFTKKNTGKESKKDCLQGSQVVNPDFKSLSVCMDSLVGKMLDGAEEL